VNCILGASNLTNKIGWKYKMIVPLGEITFENDYDLKGLLRQLNKI
jgi:hypothetical protein